MAIITVTPGSVIRVSGGVARGTAGEAILAGQSVYLDPTTQLYLLARAGGVLGLAAAAGIALNGASLNQPIAVQSDGDITIGGTVVVGQIYVVAAAFGGIAPYSDLVSTNFVTLLAIGLTAAILRMGINVSGIAKP